MFILINRLHKYCSKFKSNFSHCCIKAKDFIVINAQLNNFFLVIDEVIGKNNGNKPINRDVPPVIRDKKSSASTNKNNADKKPLTLTNKNILDKKLLAIKDKNIADKKSSVIGDKKLPAIINGSTTDKKLLAIEDKKWPATKDGKNINKRPLAIGQKTTSTSK